MALDLDAGRTFIRVPDGRGRLVDVTDAELSVALLEAARNVTPQADPLAAAERAFALAELSGRWVYEVRTNRLVPEATDRTLDGDGSAEPLTREYLDWCGRTRLGAGDCLGLLIHSKVLTPHGRCVLAFAMARASSLDSMMESLRPLGDPRAMAATLASGAAMYLTLWLLPEPISKVIATSITVFFIGYVGLDAAFSVRDAWLALTTSADQAKSFAELREAADDFGAVTGPHIGKVLLLLVSHGLGKGLTARGLSLPGLGKANLQAQAQLGVRLGTVAGVQAVTVGPRAVAISLASSAMAMASIGGSRPSTSSPEQPSRAAQMQKEVERGQAPREIERVDKPHVPGQQAHVHYKDGTSSNQDGSIHDAHRGAPSLSNAAAEWLIKHGWVPPK